MRTQLISWGAAFSLGVVLCALVLSGLSRRPVTEEPSVSLTPAMDLLNNYSCRWAETKHVILGGREDGYSPDGEERRRPGSFYDYYVTRTGTPTIGASRDYDEDGFDNAFIERFDAFPPRIAHGLFVVRFRQLGSLKTDYLNIGRLENGQAFSSTHSTSLDPEAMKPNWTYSNGVISTRLAEASFKIRYGSDNAPLPSETQTVLEYIKHGKTALDLVISDDTIVDMVGFAVCTEPETRKGTTFLVTTLTSDIVNVACTAMEGGENHCNRLAGDTMCDSELPLTCFAELQTAPPEDIRIMEGPNLSWSGGRIAFTPPIRGDSIASQSEGHAVCRAAFGAPFRMANIHDGAQSVAFTGYGKMPGTAQVWVDSNLEPYGNCWPRTADYPDRDRMR